MKIKLYLMDSEEIEMETELKKDDLVEVMEASFEKVIDLPKSILAPNQITRIDILEE
jgi:hypothetical protein